MSGEYLSGRLTVDYGLDVVSLIYKVHGRVSYMFLTEGDLIEVEQGSNWKTISVETVLETVIGRSIEGTAWKRGESFYQGSYVRVKLNPIGNRRVNSLEKRWAVSEILEYFKRGFISQEEAAQALAEIEPEGE